MEIITETTIVIIEDQSTVHVNMETEKSRSHECQGMSAFVSIF